MRAVGKGDRSWQLNGPSAYAAKLPGGMSRTQASLVRPKTPLARDQESTVRHVQRLNAPGVEVPSWWRRSSSSTQPIRKAPKIQ